VIEYSLSVDNIFVFILIFSYFKVADDLQHEVLFWGVFGALVFRLVFVLVGVELLQRFYWVIYIFGAFLIYTGINLAFNSNKTVNPQENLVLKLVHKLLPVTDNYHSDHFFIKRSGSWAATPLFVVLIVIETSDIVFALDSIPAVLAVTQERFIAFSSNAFAVLGLRALYFALSSVIKMFHYLNYGLAVVLIFVGIKMVLSEIYPIPSLYALGFIILTLATSVVTSILFPPRKETANQQQC
jgi:tellurite resistance protein TerC